MSQDKQIDAVERRLRLVSASDVDHGGGGGDDGGMEARLAKLEQDVAIIKSNYATKADLAEAKNSIIMWVVSAILLAQLLPPLLRKLGLT